MIRRNGGKVEKENVTIAVQRPGDCTFGAEFYRYVSHG